MKKILSFCLFLTFLSCDDGDLQIATIDFDNAIVQFCDPLTPELLATSDGLLLFQTNGDEALALVLESGLILNETDLDTTVVRSTFSTASELTFRLLSGNVNAEYFCSSVPPIEPTIINETIATAGNIHIASRVNMVTESTKTYQHTINFSDLNLENDLSERLTDSTNFLFGEITTSTQSSLGLVFANYQEIPIMECDNAITANTVRLFKLLGDEFISIDIPSTLIANAVTTTPREMELDDNFSNAVLGVLATDDFVCSSSGIASENIVNTFNSENGSISVSTLASGPDANGNETFIHTITLNNFQLRGSVQGAELQEAISTLAFGNYTTTAL